MHIMARLIHGLLRNKGWKYPSWGVQRLFRYLQLVYQDGKHNKECLDAYVMMADLLHNTPHYDDQSLLLSVEIAGSCLQALNLCNLSGCLFEEIAIKLAPADEQHIFFRKAADSFCGATRFNKSLSMYAKTIQLLCRGHQEELRLEEDDLSLSIIHLASMLFAEIEHQLLSNEDYKLLTPGTSIALSKNLKQFHAFSGLLLLAGYCQVEVNTSFVLKPEFKLSRQSCKDVLALMFQSGDAKVYNTQLLECIKENCECNMAIPRDEPTDNDNPVREAQNFLISTRPVEDARICSACLQSTREYYMCRCQCGVAWCGDCRDERWPHHWKTCDWYISCRTRMCTGCTRTAGHIKTTSKWHRCCCGAALYCTSI